MNRRLLRPWRRTCPSPRLGDPAHFHPDWAGALLSTKEQRRELLETLDAYLQHSEANAGIRNVIIQIRPEVERWVEKSPSPAPDAEPAGNGEKSSD
ncbi:MAG: hypothetical protein GXP31_02155 [Kiritimatiellaeota bacterium]|nr:hypothetical protein [Kiritimatiellota bacterium]